MNHPNDMDGDIKKLLTLLKKILKNHPQGWDQISKLMEQKGDPKSFNLNLCFFTFIPMSPEELMEFEEMYDDYLNEVEESISRHDDSKLEFKLNTDDIDFLKKNGIRFN